MAAIDLVFFDAHKVGYRLIAAMAMFLPERRTRKNREHGGFPVGGDASCVTPACPYCDSIFCLDTNGEGRLRRFCGRPVE